MSHGKTVLMLNPCNCPYFWVQVCLAGLYDILKGHLYPSEEWKVFSKLRNVSSQRSLRSRCREPVIQTFHKAPSPTGSLRAKDSAISKTSTAAGSRRFYTACGGLVAAGKTWLWLYEICRYRHLGHVSWFLSWAESSLKPLLLA